MIVNVLIGWFVKKLCDLVYSLTSSAFKYIFKQLPFQMISKSELRELRQKAECLRQLSQTYDEVRKVGVVDIESPKTGANKWLN